MSTLLDKMPCAVCSKFHLAVSELCRYAGETPMTFHHVGASPRLARLYRIMHLHGIELVDWSTDMSVRGVLPQLRALLSDVEGGKPVEGLPDALRVQYASDLRIIIGRTPEERVTNENKKTIAVTGTDGASGDGW